MSYAERRRPVSDEGRLIAATVQLAIAEGHAGLWMAFRLSDGGSDKIKYHSRRAAISHQFHASQCCYVKVPHDNMTPAEATAYLSLCRANYSMGNRDPEHEPIPTGM